MVNNVTTDLLKLSLIKLRIIINLLELKENK